MLVNYLDHIATQEIIIPLSELLGEPSDVLSWGFYGPPVDSEGEVILDKTEVQQGTEAYDLALALTVEFDGESEALTIKLTHFDFEGFPEELYREINTIGTTRQRNELEERYTAETHGGGFVLWEEGAEAPDFKNPLSDHYLPEWFAKETFEHKGRVYHLALWGYTD